MQRKKSINKVTSNAAITNRKSAAHVGTANTMPSAEGGKKRCLKISTPNPLKKGGFKRALFFQQQIAISTTYADQCTCSLSDFRSQHSKQTFISLVNYVLQHSEEKATPILILLISSVTNTCYCLTGKCSCSSFDLF